MALALVAHACPSDRLQLWVGVTGGDSPPLLVWNLDGKPVTAEVKRALQPVLRAELAAKADRKVWTGCFELAGLAADQSYEIGARTADLSVIRRVRTLPRRIPDGPQERFTILLVSCFDIDEDSTGAAGDVLSRLKVRPDLTILAGDQVYLDIPTAENFADDAAWLANRFQSSYVKNWFGTVGQPNDPREVPRGFPQVLSLAPCAFLPDDHEFWNNYPFSTPPVQNSWTFGGRERWKRAAEQVYEGLQQTAEAAFGQGRILDIDPLSILLLDTRSQRDIGTAKREPSRNGSGDLLGDAGRALLKSWVDGLVASARSASVKYGMLVTGQSLFSPSAGPYKGGATDYEFADYEADFRFMVEQIERVSASGLPIILATGDVHWGRVLEAHGADSVNGSIYEVISSPTSLVSTIVSDQAKEVWGAIKGVLGMKDHWPRHRDAQKPAGVFGTAGQFHVAVAQRKDQKAAVMRGNQAAMLRFAQLAGGIDVEVTYFSLSGDAAFDDAEEWSLQLRLRPPRGAIT
jgi:hypothetical protein